jgi:glycosyltransferase involved in cell wall biosynthesis
MEGTGVSMHEAVVVGHPFGPLGISRVARLSFASLRAVGTDAAVLDVWKATKPAAAHADIARRQTGELGHFNLFHLNGDEIDRALDKVGGLPAGTHNVIYPMWELPRYPAEWARQLERFDEVWAGSRFIEGAVREAVSIPVVHMPLATQVSTIRLRSRRFFGVPESMYAFLFFFDLRSYEQRKNPQAVIDAFARFLDARPWAQACLVIKVHGTANAPGAAAELAAQMNAFGRRGLLIDQLMAEDEVHALVYSCDAFVSLHRAEGYGLGLAEAMCLAKPVIGTAYSGNMDFMTAANSKLVSYQIVSVPPDAYPHSENQTWAEPDIDEATRSMIELYDDPAGGRELGRRASSHMQAHFSCRAAGLRYVDRVAAF